MSFSKLSPFLALFILFFLFFQTPTFAAKLSYIVYMGVHSHGLEDTEATVTKVKDSHCQFLTSFLGSSEKAKEAIFYSYFRDINGFAVTPEDEEAAAIASTYKHYKTLDDDDKADIFGVFFYDDDGFW